MGNLTLVLGGIRSGKSGFAERLASSSGRRLLYLATGVAGDDEMRERIRRHRARRSSDWTTVEAALDPAAALSTAGAGWDAVLVESISGWVANLLLSGEQDHEASASATTASAEVAVAAGVRDLVAWQRRTGICTVLVTDEVGLSLVASNPQGRQYQDLLGAANQDLAAQATDVYFVAAGLPLQLKGHTQKLARRRRRAPHDPDRG